MRKHPVISIAALALLIAAVVWLTRPRSGTVVIHVSGLAGLKFQGSCEIDGSTRDLSGIAPARFRLEGHKMVYSITP